MSAQAPQVLSRRTNGVPSPGATQTNESSSGKPATDGGAARPARGRGASDKGSEAKSTNDADAPKSSRTKAPSEGEKLVVRRLPPGLTQAEFVSILGEEWELGNGKVDWFYYARGKVSNDPSKPTRPGRAYLHLMRKDHILPLSEVVRAASWEDAKGTYTSPSLVGPPSLEFAAYKKIPGNRKRTDARQGTIDQDPEFMAFLEGLANPTPVKEGPEHEEGEDGGKTEVTTTPLIEYLKEKKANKIKEAAAAKSAKHSRLEASSKARASAKESEGSSRKGKDSKSSRSEKGPAKENVKILTKKAAVEQAAETAKSVASQMSNPGPSTGAKSAAAATINASAEPAPKNRRAGIAQAARILQRDLGLSPGSAHRRARQDAAKADPDSKTTPAGKEPAPAARESQSSAAAPAESTNAQPSRAQPSASAASKTQTSSRRSRGSGTRNSERSKNTESMSAENVAAPAPVILKKKPTSESDAPRAATSSAHAPSSQPKTTSGGGGSSTNSRSNANANANVPSGSRTASQQKAVSSSSAKKSASSAPATIGRGFVKHANASQGISETALRQALEGFGTITSIEVDKRKGFAYVDFADHASLVKAISSSPVTIAQGTISVMERKDKKPAAAAAAAAAAAPSSTASGSSSAAGSTPASATAAPPEKSTSRGRRGRGGGGNKSHAATNGTQAADPPATNGPG